MGRHNDRMPSSKPAGHWNEGPEEIVLGGDGEVDLLAVGTGQSRVAGSAGSWQQQNVSAGCSRMKVAVRNTGVTKVRKAVSLL